MSKLSHGLSLNQMQLLAYAIFCTQKDGKTEFIKADFESRFNIDYKTEHAREDASKLSHIQFSIEDLENDHFEYWNVFSGIRYRDGLFTFKWNEEFVPHILELQEKFVTTDLTITSQFKSGFSWTLYDYLKAHYGYWHKQISKEGLMKLFGVEDRKTYQNNTGRFKSSVLDVAIAEINQYTELEVDYDEIKRGRSIVGFKLKWSTGATQKSATKSQISTLKTTIDMVIEDAFIFIDLNNEENRQFAITIVKETRDMLDYTSDKIGITYEIASELIQKANDNLRALSDMLEKEKRVDTSVYYNWLEE